ncbi:SDR family NAD(P)-dependent oxidoreductase [Sphingobium mellinum]|uniref:SDR family NAD(P)-dependent oxidoreductase n=1 Tax=Sphingobium mellinum TaxID=1387166 RepID=UPI0030ED9634
MLPFQDKNIVVLGASAQGGTGWETAKLAAEQGARVTVGARSMAGIQELAGLIGGTGVRCDASIEAEVEAMAEAAFAANGPIDVAIMAAGVPFVGMIDAIDPKDVRQAFDINYFGPFFFIRHMARRMRDGGAMVVITSTAASMPVPGYSSYGSAKAAAQILVEHAALEYAARNIRINAVEAGLIDTPMSKILLDHEVARKVLLKEIPLGRPVTPRQVGAACLWLCHPDAAVTGDTLNVDNGNHLRRNVQPEELPYEVMAANADASSKK